MKRKKVKIKNTNIYAIYIKATRTLYINCNVTSDCKLIFIK